MEIARSGKNRETLTLNYDLGTFEGFNFRHQGAICPNQTAEEVVNWDHDREGEAEFWPSGDNPGVSAVFEGRSSVCGSEIVALDELLRELGGDTTENFLRIHYAVTVNGEDLGKLTREKIEDLPLHIYQGSSFLDLRNDAAYELFELYYPEEYRVWEASLCDGLIFDCDRFIDSPTFSTSEVTIGDLKALIVKPD